MTFSSLVIIPTVIKRIINISEDNWIIITLRIIPVSKPPLNKTTVLIFITTVDNLTKMADAYLRRTHITLVTSQIRSIEITQRSIAIS